MPAWPRARADPARTWVIHNGVASTGSRRPRLRGAPPVIVSVGRLAAPKDPLALVAALARLPAGAFRAVLVGGGPKRAATSPARSAARGSRAWSSSSATATTSPPPWPPPTSSSSPAAPRASRCPCSRRWRPGCRWWPAPSAASPRRWPTARPGCWWRPGDVDALAGAIERLLADGTLRRAMGSAGRARAAEHFALGALSRRRTWRSTSARWRPCRSAGGGRPSAAPARHRDRRPPWPGSRAGRRARRPGRGAGPADRSRGR